jgi:hypothetical protein
VDGGKLKQRTAPPRKEFTQRRPVKRVENYSWTPVNALARKILMEIRKDPDYKDPSPIKGRTLPHNRHKYCHYHDSYGHCTNTFNEKYIVDGKLTCFLGKREDLTAKHQPDRSTGDHGSSRRDVRSGRPPYRQERRPARQPDVNFQAERAPQRERSRSRGRQDGSGTSPRFRP